MTTISSNSDIKKGNYVFIWYPLTKTPYTGQYSCGKISNILPGSDEIRVLWCFNNFAVTREFPTKYKISQNPEFYKYVLPEGYVPKQDTPTESSVYNNKLPDNEYLQLRERFFELKTHHEEVGRRRSRSRSREGRRSRSRSRDRTPHPRSRDNPPPPPPPSPPPPSPPARPDPSTLILDIINNGEFLHYITEIKEFISNNSLFDLQKYIKKYEISNDQKNLIPYFELFQIIWAIKNEATNKTITDEELNKLYIQFNRYFNFIYRDSNSTNLYNITSLLINPRVPKSDPNYSKQITIIDNDNMLHNISITTNIQENLNMNEKVKINYENLINTYFTNNDKSPNIYCRIYNEYYSALVGKTGWQYLYNPIYFTPGINCIAQYVADPFRFDDGYHTSIVGQPTEVHDEINIKNKPILKNIQGGRYIFESVWYNSIYYSGNNIVAKSINPLTEKAEQCCYICGNLINHNDNRECDHIIPIMTGHVLGVNNNLLNYAPIHINCNKTKGNKSPEVTIIKPRPEPRQPADPSHRVTRLAVREQSMIPTGIAEMYPEHMNFAEKVVEAIENDEYRDEILTEMLNEESSRNKLFEIMLNEETYRKLLFQLIANHPEREKIFREMFNHDDIRNTIYGLIISDPLYLAEFTHLASLARPPSGGGFGLNIFKALPIKKYNHIQTLSNNIKAVKMPNIPKLAIPIINMHNSQNYDVNRKAIRMPHIPKKPIMNMPNLQNYEVNRKAIRMPILKNNKPIITKFNIKTLSLKQIYKIINNSIIEIEAIINNDTITFLNIQFNKKKYVVNEIAAVNLYNILEYKKILNILKLQKLCIEYYYNKTNKKFSGGTLTIVEINNILDTYFVNINYTKAALKDKTIAEFLPKIQGTDWKLVNRKEFLIARYILLAKYSVNLFNTHKINMGYIDLVSPIDENQINLNLPDWLKHNKDGTRKIDTKTGKPVQKYDYHHFLGERLIRLTNNGILLRREEGLD